MTFETTPIDYSSVNDSLVYVVYDAHAANPTTYPNYKYVAEVWIGGTKKFTGKYFPQPDTNRGIIAIDNVIREYINTSLKTELKENDFFLSVQVKIREEYSGSVGAVVATSNSRIFTNHYNGRYNDFTLLPTYANKVASTRPKTIYMESGCTTYYLPYFATSTTAITVIKNGTSSTITPSQATTMQNINIAIGATSDYNVSINGVVYNLKVNCSGFYKNYVVHFLNQFGGYESMLFNKANKSTFDIERKTFQQLPYRVDGSGVVSIKSGSIMNKQKTTFASKFTEKLKIQTDFLEDSEHQWLLQLVASPDIYLQDGSTIYPINLTDTNYDVKQYNSDRLQTLSLTIEFNTSYKTQFQ